MVTVVTGATGFIGGALLEELVRRGYKVRALARKTSNISKLEALGVEIAYGDLQDKASLEALLDSCDYLYHAAAMVDLWTTDPRLYYEVNVKGTKNLFEAAMKKGVKRVVYTSSAATICPKRGGIITEDTPPKRQSLGGYSDSKWLAEEEAFKMLNTGLPLILINPTNVYGPGSISNMNRTILDVLKRKLPGIPNSRTNLVFIDDVVRGHMLGFEKGVYGRRYLIAGDDIEIGRAFQMAADIAGLKLKVRRFPVWIPSLYASYREILAKFTKKQPPISRDEMKTVSAGVSVDSSKTRQELDYTPTSVREGMEKFITWLQQSGYLSARV